MALRRRRPGRQHFGTLSASTAMVTSPCIALMIAHIKRARSPHSHRWRRYAAALAMHRRGSPGRSLVIVAKSYWAKRYLFGAPAFGAPASNFMHPLALYGDGDMQSTYAGAPAPTRGRSGPDAHGVKTLRRSALRRLASCTLSAYTAMVTCNQRRRALRPRRADAPAPTLTV